LMSATEYGTKGLHDDDFGRSLLRNILFAIRETRKEDSPQAGRNWLYNELPDYWNIKQRIIHILQYTSTTASHIDSWLEDIHAVKLLLGYIENDHV